MGPVLKGQLSSQHRVDSDPQRPDVHELGVVGLPSEDLRRSVGGRAADRLAQLILVAEAAEAEVDQLGLAVPVE